MRTHACLIALALAACDSGPVVAPPEDCPDIEPPPAPEDVILELYEGDVRSWQPAAGLPPEWADWMVERKDRFAYAYVIGRTQDVWRVEVRYETLLAYDPPWTSEDEHMAALETMAELQYPGWDFTFSLDDPGADIVAHIGYRGTSHSNGRDIYLVWEGIFGHEFGHSVGIPHHYCDSTLEDCPDTTPPGEGPCIMSRNSATWGPTEAFLLRLEARNDDEAVYEAVGNLNDRYPPDWPN